MRTRVLTLGMAAAAFVCFVCSVSFASHTSDQRPWQPNNEAGLSVTPAGRDIVAGAAASQQVEVNPVVFQDISQRRLADIVPTSNQGPSRHEIIELKRIPLPGDNAGPGPAPPVIRDNAIQLSHGPPLFAAPTPTPTPQLNFFGVGSGLGNYVPKVSPPDPNGAVGRDHYVQWVNNHFAVFDKASGRLVYGPAPGNTLWADFEGSCAKTNDGDTIVLYDKLAGRWVLTQFSNKDFTKDATGAIVRRLYRQCVAVSTSPDALGTYQRFEFEYANFNDYPKMSVWPDGYFISFNMFQELAGQPGEYKFLGSTICAYDRRAMLGEVDRAVTQHCKFVGRSGGLLPADIDSTALPPDGSTNFFLNFGVNSLNLWKFQVDWSAPANTRITGPISIPVAAFTPACRGSSCAPLIPQKDVLQPLDSLGDRLMYRLSYRHFTRPDGTTEREALLVNHSVTVRPSAATSRTGIRWYELRNPAGATLAGAARPEVKQHGTYAPDPAHRWMGSIAMDKAGNIALAYNVSGANLFPSIRYTAHKADDPAGVMRKEQELLAGSGSQGTLSRWGDYTSLTVDPADDCTMWYTTQFYNRQSDEALWSTRIFSFKLPWCK